MQGQSTALPSTWHFFISHASEDKEAIAAPLASLLQTLGFRVWYDDFTLRLGDSLNQSINRGLARSDYGIVILSPNFFAKNWPQRELDGLVARESASGQKLILPIWHDLTLDDVLGVSPALADLKACQSADGVENVVREILKAVEDSIDLPGGLPTPAHDMLLPDDVVDGFLKIPELSTWTFSNSEIERSYLLLLTTGIRTRQALEQLTSSRHVLDALRDLLIHELNRPPERSLTPNDIASYGGYLLTNGVLPDNLEEVKKLIRRTKEYQGQHPDAKIPPIWKLTCPRMRSGQELSKVLTGAGMFHFDYDEPQTEMEVALIGNFRENIQDWDIIADISGRAVVEAEYQLTMQIRELELNGYHVYAAAKTEKSPFRLGEQVKEIPMSTAYVVVRRVELEQIILIREP